VTNTLDFIKAYSQYFIYFVTYEWVKQATVFNCTRLERLARDKHTRYQAQS